MAWELRCAHLCAPPSARRGAFVAVRVRVARASFRLLKPPCCMSKVGIVGRRRDVCGLWGPARPVRTALWSMSMYLLSVRLVV